MKYLNLLQFIYVQYDINYQKIAENDVYNDA